MFPAQSHDRAGDPFQLQRLAAFQIRLHRRAHASGHAVGQRHGRGDRVVRHHDATRAGNRRGLGYKRLEGRALFGVAKDWSHGFAIEGRRSGSCGEENELAPDLDLNLLGDYPFDPRFLQGVGKGLDPRRDRAIHFAKDQAGEIGMVPDHAGLGDFSGHVDDRSQHMLAAQGIGEDTFGLDAILERDNRGVVGNQRLERAGHSVKVNHLHADHHHVARSDPGNAATYRGVRDENVAHRRMDLKAVTLHGLLVRAARGEMDIVTGRRQFGTKEAADAACADDRDFHGALSLRMLMIVRPAQCRDWAVKSKPVVAAFCVSAWPPPSAMPRQGAVAAGTGQ